MENLLTPEQVKTYINSTQHYGASTTYKKLNDYVGPLSQMDEKIQAKSKSFTDEDLHSIGAFESRNDMIKMALDFFKKLDPTMGAKVEKLLSDYMVTKNIQLIEEGQSSGKVTIEGENDTTRINLNINLRKDATGFICLCQQLTDAVILREQSKIDTVNDKITDNFMAKTAKQFMTFMLIDYIGDNSHLTPQQKEALQIDALQETSRDIQALAVDKEIFEAMYEQDPSIFENNLENYTPENFYNAMVKFEDKPQSMEIINDRIKDIAEDGKTTHYLMGSVLSTISAFEMQDQFIKGNDHVMTDLLNGINNNATLSQVTGISNSELVASGSNIIDNLNDQTRAQAREARLDGRYDENDIEMVMQRQKVVNNTATTQKPNY